MKSNQSGNLRSYNRFNRLGDKSNSLSEGLIGGIGTSKEGSSKQSMVVIPSSDTPSGSDKKFLI